MDWWSNCLRAYCSFAGHIPSCIGSHAGLPRPQSCSRYHRHWDDGRYADASGCGNETASDLQQMRDFIINSTRYWAQEYHVDGFRFDL